MLKKSFIILLALTLSHCTSKRLINPADSGDASWQALNRNQGKAEVTLNNDQKILATQFQARSDSATWVNAVSGRPQTVATAEIKTIRFKKSGRGALQGLGIGLLAGAAAGAIIGLASGDDPPCETDPNDAFGFGRGICEAFRLSAAEKAAAGAVALGIAGMLVGTPTGALIGSKEEYRFQQRNEKP